ncbi:hypothetical protein IRJ41_014553 [Triplophysa rosa]|uniref:C-type lectin domain-containing protein n=1 Tax=Triplophysa rosa TaxID=992332 RepID=A0A9W8CBS4_TRIRA|nr:hypothetical protein IRJ41_014553 [Triplophysa rosa]
MLFTEEMKIFFVVALLSAHCELTIALTRKHFYINETKLWGDAQRYCREHYDDLSSVDSLEEFTGIGNARNSYSWSWVGLRKISGQWLWSDGSNQYFYNWGDSQPNQEDSTCALVIYGHLNDWYCGYSYPFFCYKWEPKLIVVREKKSWEDALQYCRTHHTDLASLPTFFHHLQVNKITAMVESSSVWTGLRFHSGSWFWVSGEALGDQVWLPSCPVNNSYCGSRNLNTLSWENRDCMETLYFVCY